MWHKGKNFAGIVAFILLLVSFTFLEEAQAVEVNVAISKGPTTLDPRQATDASSVRFLRLVAPGILELDENFKPSSRYLSSFGHKGYKEFFVEVKDGITFSDGTPLTATFLKEYYQSILDPKTKSPLKGAFADVVKISIENNNRLLFILKKSNPYFWGALEVGVVKLNGEEAKKPIGLGRYKLVSLDDFGNVSLRRLDNLQTLNFKVINDPTVRYLKLAKGNVDILHNDISEELLQYGEKAGYKVYESPATSYTYMGFLMQGEGVKTANVNVRRALSLAINRTEIVNNLLGGRASPAQSLLSVGHPAYYVADVSYNPQKAEALLDEVGYTRGENGTRFTLRLAITSNPFIQRLAQVVQQDLAQVGVKVDISSSEWGTFYGNIKKGNFESYILTWVGRFQSDIFYSLFHSSMMPPNGANRGRYQSDKMDGLLDAMMAETDDDKRKNLVVKIQKQQAEDMIYVPLWKRHHAALVSPSVRGYSMSEDGDYRGLEKVFKE